MGDELPFGDDLELRLVRRPEGSRRSKSTASPGAERDLLRDSTGALLGPTESYPVNLGELREALARSKLTRQPTHRQRRSPGKQMAVNVATDVAYTVVREILVQGYQLVIAPKARAKWNELKQNRRPGHAQVGNEASPSELAVFDIAQGNDPSTDLAAQRPTIVMDSVEFRERLALMLAAENFAAEQRHLLSAARINDEADLPPELAHAITLVLQEDTASLDDVTLELLMGFLTRNDTEFVELDDGHFPELESLGDEE